MKKTINLIWHNLSANELTETNILKIWEFEWLCSLLSEFNLVHKFDCEYKTCANYAIIIASGKYRNQAKDFVEYIKKFKKSSFKFGFIHLGDEWCTDFIDFYDEVDFIFRNYYRREVSNSSGSKCFYFPLGYKTDFSKELNKRPITSRKYSWFFAGQIKASRSKMLNSAKKVPGGFLYQTRSFNDPEGLNTQIYADMLANTVFALCPRGNFSVDTFRLYEALEAGAIPIVEDRGGFNCIKEIFEPQGFLSTGCYKPSYWRLNSRYFRDSSYWQQAFGSEFPCPRIYDWNNLENLINEIDVIETSLKINLWWENYKAALSSFMCSTITEGFWG